MAIKATITTRRSQRHGELLKRWRKADITLKLRPKVASPQSFSFL
jgi:hypothetical protein